MLISSQHKLAEVIHHDFSLIPIISRFGIPFGFGDKTIHEICNENTINSDFFIEILNAFHDKDYKPDKKLQIFSTELTVDYLKKSHNYYNNVKIPLLEKLINQLKWNDSKQKNHNQILVKFFNDYKKEVSEHIQYEENTIYPYVLKIEQTFLSGQTDNAFKSQIKTQSIRKYEGEHEELNTSLLDLKNIIIKYLPPADNSELTERILIEVFRLEKDMKDHTGIEDKVLIPKVSAMENAILNF